MTLTATMTAPGATPFLPWVTLRWERRLHQPACCRQATKTELLCFKRHTSREPDYPSLLASPFYRTDRTADVAPQSGSTAAVGETSIGAAKLGHQLSRRARRRLS
jgi:hypothetical protein